jgi:hypothetical protein
LALSKLLIDALILLTQHTAHMTRDIMLGAPIRVKLRLRKLCMALGDRQIAKNRISAATPEIANQCT